MEKIKLSQIRAQFPMYADVPDEQLLIGLRQKYYSDIPSAQFYSRIEWDNVDPTEGMSGGQRFLAGVGKGMTDVARGLGQMVGVVDREDVAQARKRDEALTRTGAGMAGNVAGSVAAMLPTALIPGANTMAGAAAIGAGTGLAAPSVSTGETLQNVLMGGALAPAALGVGRAVGATARGAQSLMEPFTKKGQERIAARTLQQFATDPQKAAESLRSARQLVPGSAPTMAQAADDPGLAQLERTLRNNPETGGLITSQLEAQRAARLSAVQNVAGDDAYYNAIKEGRAIFAAEDYAKAIADGFDPEKLQAAAPKLEALLKRPSIRAAQAKARELAQESGEELTDVGSVRGLDYLVKALDNKISAAKNLGSSIGKEDLRSLTNTKNELLSLIEDVAPAYKAARDNFAGMSRQVNSMDVGRDLLNRMQSPLARAGASGRELKNEYARALEGATESVKRATGMDLPLDRVMTKRDMDTLQNVAKDMARSAKADDMGRAVGSNTAQNLAAQNLMRRILGPTGMPETWAESNVLQAVLSPYTGLTKLAGAENAVLERLTRASLSPQDAATLMLLTQQPSRAGLLGVEAMRYIPGASAGLLGQFPE